LLQKLIPGAGTQRTPTMAKDWARKKKAQKEVERLPEARSTGKKNGTTEQPPLSAAWGGKRRAKRVETRGGRKHRKPAEWKGGTSQKGAQKPLFKKKKPNSANGRRDKTGGRGRPGPEQNDQKQKASLI